MNCKPGDLAVVVRSVAGNEGRIVTILGPYLFAHPMYWPAWCVESDGAPLNGGSPPWFPDACLRPIRPGDISDEEVRDLYAPKIPEVA